MLDYMTWQKELKKRSDRLQQLEEQMEYRKLVLEKENGVYPSQCSREGVRILDSDETYAALKYKYDQLFNERKYIKTTGNLPEIVIFGKGV